MLSSLSRKNSLAREISRLLKHDILRRAASELLASLREKGAIASIFSGPESNRIQDLFRYSGSV
jgi:hypothetical protein